MSAERDELQRLVDELPDQELPAAIARLRQLRPAKAGPWPPAWFGAATATRTDTAARADELLAEGFARTS